MPAIAAMDNETLDHLLSVAAYLGWLQIAPFCCIFGFRLFDGRPCHPAGAHRGHETRDHPRISNMAQIHRKPRVGCGVRLRII
jgi:hypothetical protein